MVELVAILIAGIRKQLVPLCTSWWGFTNTGSNNRGSEGRWSPCFQARVVSMDAAAAVDTFEQ